MSRMNPDDLSELSMLELFRLEVETQAATLTNGLLGLERQTDTTQHLAELMRAAHSLKGAARIVGRKPAVRVAHGMEECFVAAQKEKLTLSGTVVDSLLEGVDLLNRIAQVPEESFKTWEASEKNDIDTYLNSLTALVDAVGSTEASIAPSPAVDRPATLANGERSTAQEVEQPGDREEPTSNRTLRVTAENLNRLMGLAGEALVASRWVDVFSTDLQRMKHAQRQLYSGVESMRELISATSAGTRELEKLTELRDQVAKSQVALTERLVELEQFDRRFINFSTRLYHEVLDCRMRPFTEGTQGFHRMVRDVARQLGKKVKLDIKGEATLVDRDILERLKAPLDHLLRNAIDHGIEAPVDRRAQGKPEDGTLELHASHRAGMLLITLADDGRGVDPEAVRDAIVRKKLTTLETTQKMNQAELFEFLFLPDFTLKESVSEISGRGVGLDAVHAMAKDVGGRVRISSQLGRGTRFQLELPLTLSVVRTLLVEIADEPYALPLARIERAIKVSQTSIEVVQGRQHFALDDHQVGLVTAHQVLGLNSSPKTSSEASVIVLGDKAGYYGLVVDRFLSERELVVRTLDPRLGKVKNVSSAALMPDGSPILILDVDDLRRSIENIALGRRQLHRVGTENGPKLAVRQKRVLVVDDSLTVRELERKLLHSRGYAVDVAVDGMDGWNAVRNGHYDLMISDIDMPRLDGIELLKLVREDSRLKSLPVMVVSYKDREEDRNRGLEAGADYYLTKASFHDETLLRVVVDLIGEAIS
jgi:two-component system sensor histidine kinase and response regulator WspE